MALPASATQSWAWGSPRRQGCANPKRTKCCRLAKPHSMPCSSGPARWGSSHGKQLNLLCLCTIGGRRAQCPSILVGVQGCLSHGPSPHSWPRPSLCSCSACECCMSGLGLDVALPHCLAPLVKIKISCAHTFHCVFYEERVGTRNHLGPPGDHISIRVALSYPSHWEASVYWPCPQ